MQRKKQAPPFDLRDPIVPEVRGTTAASSDIVGANKPSEQPSAEF